MKSHGKLICLFQPLEEGHAAEFVLLAAVPQCAAVVLRVPIVAQRLVIARHSAQQEEKRNKISGVLHIFVPVRGTKFRRRGGSCLKTGQHSIFVIRYKENEKNNIRMLDTLIIEDFIDSMEEFFHF